MLPPCILELSHEHTLAYKLPRVLQKLNIPSKLPSHSSLTATAAQNFDEYDSNDEGQDEETSTYLSREIEKAENDGHPEGKPGSLLNRMISHGNKKTEEQLARDSAARAAGQNSGPVQNA